MRKVYGIGGGLVMAIVSAVIAVAAFSGGSSAAGPAPSRTPAATGTVAIAIGQLNEDGGDSATVDLHAANKDGKVGGTFRFFSDEYGYYNGGVKTLKVENGVITVTGGGGLFPPGGGRVQVQYTGVFDTSNNQATVTVKTRNGTSYTMEGTIDGLVTVKTAP